MKQLRQAVETHILQLKEITNRVILTEAIVREAALIPILLPENRLVRPTARLQEAVLPEAIRLVLPEVVQAHILAALQAADLQAHQAAALEVHQVQEDANHIKIKHK